MILLKRSTREARPRRDLSGRSRRGGHDARGHRLHGGPALARDRGGVRAGGRRRTVARDGKVRYVGISATEKVPRPVAPGGARPRRSRLAPDSRQCGAAAGVGGGESWDVAGADAAERHHPRLLRAAGHHQLSGGGVPLQPHRRSGRGARRSRNISRSTNWATTPSCEPRSSPPSSRPASAST